MPVATYFSVLNVFMGLPLGRADLDLQLNLSPVSIHCSVVMCKQISPEETRCMIVYVRQEG